MSGNVIFHMGEAVTNGAVLRAHLPPWADVGPYQAAALKYQLAHNLSPSETRARRAGGWMEKHQAT
jgi:hypothetical protein